MSHPVAGPWRRPPLGSCQLALRFVPRPTRPLRAGTPSHNYCPMLHTSHRRICTNRWLRLTVYVGACPCQALGRASTELISTLVKCSCGRSSLLAHAGDCLDTRRVSAQAALTRGRDAAGRAGATDRACLDGEGAVAGLRTRGRALEARTLGLHGAGRAAISDRDGPCPTAAGEAIPRKVLSQVARISQPNSRGSPATTNNIAWRSLGLEHSFR